MSIDTTTQDAEIVEATDAATADDVGVTEGTLVQEELLVEEVSIDGMCGVY